MKYSADLAGPIRETHSVLHPALRLKRRRLAGASTRANGTGLPEKTTDVAMPVSTFSSGASSVRSPAHTRIARWNSTVERIAVDERRRSVNGLQEMDGNSYRDSGDWPIRSEPRSVSPEQDTEPAEAVEERGEENGHAVPRVESALDDHEQVSDIEEADEPDEDRASRLPNAQYSFSSPCRRQQCEPGDVDPINGREEPGSPGPSRSKGQSIGPASEADDTIQEHFTTPVLQPSSPRRAITARQQQDQESPSREESEHNDDDDDDDYEDHRVESEAGSTERDEPPPERVLPRRARDERTPSPSQEAPRINGNGSHVRASSIMKSTPPSRHSSQRSNSMPYNTAHIPHTKDRIRYSWQSIQDDEPNKPRIHIIKLVSNTATASAGFPQGEAFGFSISPGGRRIAAYNSARLFILQTAALPIGISQDYALRRRPLAVEIIDEGTIMAVLADEHTVNIYDLSYARVQRVRTIKLDLPTNTIALAPTGGLLAAGYEGGVEIFALDASALSTDRRAVRSQRMDRLQFSEDGSTLLGTTTRTNVSSTVVVNVPVFPSSPDGVPSHEELKEAWCSELLQPENIRNSSHAVFMREKRTTCNERLFSWHSTADTFGILNTQDLQYSNVDFPVVIVPPLSTCGGLGAAIHSPPAIDEHGDTVAMIVNDRTIRLYIVPHKAEDHENTVEAHSIDHELDEGYGCPFSEVRWVYSHSSLPAPLNNQTAIQGRLIVASPGGVVDSDAPEESLLDVEGGRIILFDFDPQFAGQPGQTFVLNLGKQQPQLLDEEKVDVESEVALVRRRTVNQSKSGGLSQRPISLGRAATTFNSSRNLHSAPTRSGSRASSISNSPSGSHPPIAFTNRSSVLSIHSMQSDAHRSLPDLHEANEANEATEVTDAMEEPYAQGVPRSRVSLQRAATAANRHRFQALEERNQDPRVSMDSQGNFLPLPEYTEEPNAPLPGKYRALAGLDTLQSSNSRPAVFRNSNGAARNPMSTPATAPASIAETFNSDQAFQAATPAPSSATSQARPSQPIPRSLQRAYSNALANGISPANMGPPPSIIGDWENVSPIVNSPIRSFPANTQGTLNGQSTLSGRGTVNGGSSLASTSASRTPEEDWDVISPVNAPAPNSPFARGQSAYRYSTSLLNPPGHTSPQRASSSSSSFGGGTMDPQFGGVSTARRMPPHMQAFRQAAASASLFPPSVPHDHVPLPASKQPQHPGSVAHPIMAWHPPAPSIASAPPMRGHSRKSSIASKSAFASTEKAKKMGWFRKKSRGSAASVVDDGKSEMTWMTGSERKCVMM